ncbi:MAG: hypothetical protein PHC61_03965 [Chitinivibrionales bacterium]|nr:hypothetical protein [Chitinivibrionales bacterium]
MKLERINDKLMLHITPKASIAFKEAWVERLSALPVEEYGVFMRDTIYPGLSVQDRKVWHRTQISNQDLFLAVKAFK